ncbi:GNAT family N-acetyltransferase [Streptomyces sp. NPDC127068]|uniref:GNAT family N-acetyltransferase n=1 Tax=Streptomyces sp. NPDC127068 TaxID=3347127 RepID=UPI003667CB94
MVTLRTITKGDWPLWQEVRVAALTDAPHAFKSRIADWHGSAREQWRASLTVPGSLHVVALRDGLPVGMVRGLPGDGGTRALRSLWVSPRARGQRVGDRLIGKVVTWARGSGATMLELSMIPGNAHALALYRRHGFVLTEALGEVLSDGVTREQVMARRLR